VTWRWLSKQANWLGRLDRSPLGLVSARKTTPRAMLDSYHLSGHQTACNSWISLLTGINNNVFHHGSVSLTPDYFFSGACDRHCVLSFVPALLHSLAFTAESKRHLLPCAGALFQGRSFPVNTDRALGFCLRLSLASNTVSVSISAET
jgi:hypothetical protein